ncbi:MAG: cyclic pyranopterin monophosphate synthase MoaC [Deltaproteobacteria bacterium]|nr:cyclic pyranopterin monophosphate synthase MoaC [Deltaproteobacteria bacterium]
MSPRSSRKHTPRAKRSAAPSPGGLSHIDARGRACMVDVGDKPVTQREAVARAVVKMAPSTLRLIQRGGIAKGEVLAVARVAGIMAAKRTAEIIPMCHPLPIQVAGVDFKKLAAGRLQIEARVKVSGQTGVEMEALMAVSAAALTVYDMCKAVDRAMVIESVRLVEKRGGRSGVFRRAE